MAAWAVLGALFWSIGFWKLLKRPEIYLPDKFIIRKLFIARALLFLIGISGWVYIGIAMTNPRIPAGVSKDKIEVRDIFFVVDVSASMLADDFKPNRLEVAKEKILDFINLRPTDRIGIITFSEKIFTLMPLSTDLKLLKQMVKEINTGFLGSGTNIGDAIGLAVARASSSMSKSKIIILLTDGVSNVGTMTPMQAAEEAQKNSVKVYTIAVGGDDNAKIPTGQDLYGNTTYRTIPGGSYDLNTLQEMAAITQAKAYVAADERTLASVMSEISKLEKSEVDTRGKIIYDEKFWYYLLVGVTLLFGVELIRKLILRESI